MKFHRHCEMMWMFTLVIFVTMLQGSVSSVGTLSRQRIYSEFRDISDQGLTLDVPFNTSIDEVLY